MVTPWLGQVLARRGKKKWDATREILGVRRYA